MLSFELPSLEKQLRYSSLANPMEVLPLVLLCSVLVSGKQALIIVQDGVGGGWEAQEGQYEASQLLNVGESSVCDRFNITFIPTLCCQLSSYFLLLSVAHQISVLQPVTKTILDIDQLIIASQIYMFKCHSKVTEVLFQASEYDRQLVKYKQPQLLQYYLLLDLAVLRQSGCGFNNTIIL